MYLMLWASDFVFRVWSVERVELIHAGVAPSWDHKFRCLFAAAKPTLNPNLHPFDFSIRLQETLNGN